MAGLESIYTENVQPGGDYRLYAHGDSFSNPGDQGGTRQRRGVQPFEMSDFDSGDNFLERRLKARNAGKEAKDVAGVEDGDNNVAISMGIAGLIIENVLCHPFLVLRRTCQVSPSDSSRFHCVPFQLIPVSVKLYGWQGTAAFYKGLSGSLTLRGLQLGAEDLTSKLTPWPKELDKSARLSLRRIGQHLALKSVSFAVTTPFYSASLIETVQSDIASEKPGIFDIFREGLCRLAPNYAGARLLPVWLLLPPTVAHGLCHYVVSSLVGMVSLKIILFHRKRALESTGAVRKIDNGTTSCVEHISAAIGHLAADVILYPVETVLNRLHLQGSRTIIDNLDTGTSVVPVLTRYEGVIDCFETIKLEEGFWGFYKGFGGLILQYSVRIAAIYGCTLIAKEVANLIAQETVAPSLNPPPLRPASTNPADVGFSHSNSMQMPSSPRDPLSKSVDLRPRSQ